MAELQAIDHLRGAASPDTLGHIDGALRSLRDPGSAIGLLAKRQRLSASDLFTIGHLATSSTKVARALSGESSWPRRFVPPNLGDVERRLVLGTAGFPTFHIADAYSPDLAKTRAARRSRERAWRAEMVGEAAEVERNLGKRPGLKEDIAFARTQEPLIAKARAMPELAEVRETLTHVHFRLKATRQAVRLERDIVRLRTREAALEEEVLELLSRELDSRVGDLERAAHALGELDYFIKKLALATKWDAVLPKIGKGDGPLVVEGAIHPQVRQEVLSRGGTYQPISISLLGPVSVITGPNMGGKTASLATMGLMVSLAQWGFLVPCKKMEFSLYDFVYFQPETRSVPGLSSFAAQIVSVRQALGRGDERGLLLLDEVGRGTNPEQGLALYAAILESVLDGSAGRFTVAASTHYHGLPAMLGVPHWQVAGLSPGALEGMRNGASEGDIGGLYRHMDYSLQKVGSDTPTPKDALVVARFLGLDARLIRRAEEFMKNSGGDLVCLD